MLQEDAGTARPSPLSVPAARPDTAYHRLDLFRARVQQAAAEHGQDIMTVLRSLITGTPWRPPAPAGMSPYPPAHPIHRTSPSAHEVNVYPARSGSGLTG
jgi:hypothetical protein